VQTLHADKKFDALRKKQDLEHQHLLSTHNKEMQSLRDMLSLSMQKFDALFDKADREIKELSLSANAQIQTLKQKVESSETRISEQKQTIQALHEQLLVFHSDYLSKIELKQYQTEVAEQIKHVTMSHINSFQECERAVKDQFYFLRDELLKLRSEMEEKIVRLSEKGESNFTTARIDKEGALKEIRLCEKTIFIIEKKIENIYLLIERLNHREETCRKLE
jgi:hypothetical protein